MNSNPSMTMQPLSARSRVQNSVRSQRPSVPPGFGPSSAQAPAVSAELRALASERVQLVQSLTDARAAAAAAAERAAAAEAALAPAAAARDAALARLAHADERLYELKRQMSVEHDTLERCAVLERRLETVESENSDLNEQLRVVKSELRAAEKECEAAKVQLGAVNEENDHLERENRRLQVELEEALNLANTAAKAADDLTIKVNSLQKSNIQLSENLSSAKITISEKTDAATAAAAAAAATAAELERAKAAVLAATTERARAVAAGQLREDAERQLSRRNDALTDQVDELLDQVAELQRKIESGRDAQIAELQAKLAAAEAAAATVPALLERTHTLDGARRRLHNELMDLRGRIRVYCRPRPASAPALRCPEGEEGSVIEFDRKGELRTFQFDRVFTTNSTQHDVFADLKQLVTSCIDGYDVTIMAYGQTGAGKTHTMIGGTSLLHAGLASPGIGRDRLLCPASGVLPRAAVAIFDHASSAAECTISVAVGVCEIYNGAAYDLLATPAVVEHTKAFTASPAEEAAAAAAAAAAGARQLRIVDGALVDQEFREVTSAQVLLDTFQVAISRRHTASTALNARSSRSHTVFQLCVTTTASTGDGKTEVRRSRLNFVDLAGSERMHTSHTLLTNEASEIDKAERAARVDEMKHINSSLSSLGKVMQQLAAGEPHVAFRDTALTRVLQPSLSGDGKCCLIVCVNSEEDNLGETANSLGFGVGARAVKRADVRRGPKRNVTVQ